MPLPFAIKVAIPLVNPVLALCAVIVFAIDIVPPEPAPSSNTKEKSDSKERTTGEKWKDKQANPDDWELTSEKTEPGREKGTTSSEREYTNKKTGEKIYEHEIKNDTIGKTTHGPHPREYGK